MAEQIKLPSKPAAAKSGVVSIATVHGDMVDPTNCRRYTQAGHDDVVMNSWIQTQVDAGKIRLLKEE